MANENSRSLSVLFVAPSAYLLSGLASWLDYIVPGLRMKGCKTFAGYVNGLKFHNFADYVKAHPDEHAISISCLTGTPMGRRRALLEAFQRCNPDLILSVNIPDVYPAVSEYKHENRRSAKAVMTCHGIQQDLFLDMQKYRDSIDAVVCTNQLSCQLSSELGGVDERRIFYAPYAPANIERRNVVSPSEDNDASRNLLYMGRFEQSQKRVFDLVEILSRLQSSGQKYRLHLAGDGPDRAELQSRFNEHGLRESVVFHGYLSTKQLSETIFPIMEAVIVPSSWETGPIVIWEAMAAGIPVVSSRYVGSGLEGALKDYRNCLLFDIGDCEAAAHKIRALADDKSLKTRLVDEAHDLVKNRYSIQTSVDGWHNVLQKIHRLETCPQNQQHHVAAKGRLDNFLGPAFGERVRSILGRYHAASDAGGEWPHSHSSTPEESSTFWDLARALDRNQEALLQNRFALDVDA